MNDFKYPYNMNKDPETIITDKSTAMGNYTSYMIDRVSQMFRIENLPETIPEKWLKLYLLCGGFAIISNDYDGQLYAYQGGLGGQPDTYYFATIATVANPFQKYSKSLKIGEECVIVPNDTLFKGVLPICERYAALIAEVDVSLWMSAVNSRALNIFVCSDDNSAKSAQKFVDDLKGGKLSVAVGDNDFVESIKSLPISASMSSGYITQLLELKQYFWGMWWQELGINTNHNMKREAINGNEAGLNDKALLPLVDDMFENWTTGFNMVNEKYGTNIIVSKTSAWKITEDEIDKEIEDESQEVKDDADDLEKAE